MQQLEEKLGTLSNGTEAVAAVMGNWNTVLRAVYMASGKFGGLEIVDWGSWVLIVSSEYTKAG